MAKDYARYRAPDEYRTWTDADIVRGVAENNGAAGREFFRRFVPGLEELARRMGLCVADAEEIADDVAADCLLSLCRLDGRNRSLPRSLHAYMDTALRNRIRDRHRSQTRRLRYETPEDFPTDAGDDAPLLCSEGSRRDSAGPGDEPVPMAFGLMKLATALDEGLSDEERLIAVWVSNDIPQELISSWLRQTYDATSRRIRRLAERLLDAAERYAERLSEEDWREIEPFFRRASREQGSRTTKWHERVQAARLGKHEQREATGP